MSSELNISIKMKGRKVELSKSIQFIIIKKSELDDSQIDMFVSFELKLPVILMIIKKRKGE